MPKKVLLVEDERLIANSEVRMLQEHGYQVVTTYSGEKAVEMVDGDPNISLILMDIDLGKGLSGTEAAQRILQTHTLPIVFLSCHTEREVVEKTEGINSYGYVVKNSGESVLLASIRTAFRLFEAETGAGPRQEKYRLLFNSINDAIFVHGIGDDNLPTNNIEVNDQATELLGYSREELLSMSLRDVVPEKSASTISRQAQRLLEERRLTFETENIRSDGGVIPVEVSAYHYTEGNKRLVISAVRDISKRKQAEKALVKKGSLLETSQALANLGSWEWNLSNDTWLFSKEWKAIHGVSDSHSTTSSLLKIAHPEDARRIEKALSEAKTKGKPYDILHRIVRADNNETRYIHAMGKAEFDRDTDFPVRVIGTAQDITEQTQERNELEEAIQQREFLMKELNHRVKNNLHMVSSLISLRDMETTEDLSDLKHRIEVIEFVHEKLHQQNDVKQIKVKQFFQELLESLFSSATDTEVELFTDILNVSIPTKTAVPLGMVVNEIATNAIKYGFTSDDTARFAVTLSEDETSQHYKLTLSNTGNPFPEDIGLENPKTLGLELVSTFVAQLDGTVELQKKPNPVFTIRFPLEV